MSQNNRYTTDIAGSAGLNMGSSASDSNHYDMSVTACSGGTIATCYVITATAKGNQTGDSDCLAISYSSTGVKSGTTARCW